MRTIRNLIGRALGHQNCPHCGDNNHWKPSTEGLVVATESKGILAVGPEGMMLLEIGHDVCVNICDECLAEPATLNAELIIEKLREDECPEHIIERARAALSELKEQQAA